MIESVVKARMSRYFKCVTSTAGTDSASLARALADSLRDFARHLARGLYKRLQATWEDAADGVKRELLGTPSSAIPYLFQTFQVCLFCTTLLQVIQVAIAVGQGSRLTLLHDCDHTGMCTVRLVQSLSSRRMPRNCDETCGKD